MRESHATSQHVVVVGAGLLGLAAAAQLARRGHRVTVLERAIPGAEASTAAAGILGPQLEHDDDGPTLDLGVCGREATLRLVDELTRELASEAMKEQDSDVGLVKNGALKVAFTDDEAHALGKRVAWQQAKGLRVDVINAATARALVPALGDGVVSAAVFPDDHCLDPRAYGRALHALVVKRGVTLKTGVPLTRLLERNGRVVGAILDDGARIEGDLVLVCAGAWSTRVPGVSALAGLDDDDVHPVRGQILELASGTDGAVGDATLDRVVYGAGGYAVPRRDGRVVCGSTTEHVGFDKSVTAAGVEQLLSRVLRLLPKLGARTILSTWAGLRPSTRDGLPLIGETRAPGLWLSTGHYRNGVLLAAVSAEIIGSLIDGERTVVDVAPYSPKRLGSSS